MAYTPVKNRLLEEVLKLLAEDGFDGIGDWRIAADRAQCRDGGGKREIPERNTREKYLGAASYARSAERRDYANGFKPKTVQPRVGELALAVPQVREGGFYHASLEKGQRSERALKFSLAEMYLQGVSTRKVAAITEQLCGFKVTSSQVSRAAAELDGALQQWRTRPLNVMPFLFLDARYEKVRHNNVVIDEAVLVAVGVVCSCLQLFAVVCTGRRQILAVSLALSEAVTKKPIGAHSCNLC